MTARTLLLCALGLVGCSENSLNGSKTSDEVSAPEDFQDGTLRLDITPPAGLATPELRPQTLLAMPPTYTGLRVDLRPTVSLYGTLLAEIAHPWAATGVPTEVLPFQGVVAAGIESSVENGKAGADETGSFTLPLVADNFYELTLVPDDAASSPLVVFQGLDVEADQDLSQTLPLGIPVYGRVTNADGTGLPDVGVRIHRTDGTNSTPSAVVHTDRTGWYTLRVADPGEYAVEILGEKTDHGDVVPSVSTAVSVFDETGATSSIDLGELTRATIHGFVRDAGGADVRDAVVRAVSTRLDSSPGSLSIETITVQGGEFTLDVLPGAYTLSLIPDYTPHPDASPTSVAVEAAAGDDVELGVIPLPDLGRLAGTVVDVEGRPVRGAQVQATQTGYGRHAYSTTTAEDGSYSLDLPVTPYEVVVTPVGTGGAVTRVNLTPGQSGNVALEVGQPVTGTLLWNEQPVAYALVEVRDLRTGALLGATSTGPDGSFALEVVVPITSDDTDAGATDSGGQDTGGTDTGTGGSDSGGTDTGGTDSGSTDTGDTAAR